MPAQKRPPKHSSPFCKREKRANAPLPLSHKTQREGAIMQTIQTKAAHTARLHKNLFTKLYMVVLNATYTLTQEKQNKYANKILPLHNRIDMLQLLFRMLP